MRRLNHQDSLMEAGEASGWRLHIASLQLYEGGLDLATVRRLYAARLPHLPPFRERLLPVPAGIDRSAWVEDDVDVADHVHGVRLPPPGSDRQLGVLVGELYARPFDRRRPLWDVWVVDGLQGGRVAVLARMHHSAADGTRGVALLSATLDPEPDSPLIRPGGEPGAGPGVAPRLRLVGAGAARLAGTPGRWTRTVADAARAAARVAVVTARGESAGLTLPVTAPRTPFNRAVTDRREVAFCSLPLAPVKRAARTEGVTVNDVVLAVCGGALRRHLQARAALPRARMIAAVPIGDAPGPGPGRPGNHWAVVIVSLGTDVEDLTERVRAVAVSARAGKSIQAALGSDLWQRVLDVPPVAIRALARGYAGLRLADLHPPLINMVVSDLRGPSAPLYCAGARLAALHPVGPVADGLGPNVTVLSYGDSLDVGVAVCPDVFGDPWPLVEALRAESEELGRRYPP